jgi:hypothetical protein
MASRMLYRAAACALAPRGSRCSAVCWICCALRLVRGAQFADGEEGQGEEEA